MPDLKDENVKYADAGAVRIAYEQFGDPANPPLLLVMGLGAQMLAWQNDFCQKVAEAGFHVTRFDNRDVGLSTHLADATPPDVMAALGGDTSSATYKLTDMAADAIGLLDAIGVQKAHIVGASMGGMIVQTMAIEHPERLLSVTSIMSTTGNPEVGGATEAAIGALLQPPAPDRETAIANALVTWKIIGSPGFPFDEDGIRTRAGISYDRAYDPIGMARQLVGILASGDRTEALGGVNLPFLVIHGEDDPLVNVSGGRATADAVPGAKIVTYPGMGHDVPRNLWDQIVPEIAGIASAS